MLNIFSMLHFYGFSLHSDGFSNQTIHFYKGAKYSWKLIKFNHFFNKVANYQLQILNVNKGSRSTPILKLNYPNPIPNELFYGYSTKPVFRLRILSFRAQSIDNPSGQKPLVGSKERERSVIWI